MESFSVRLTTEPRWYHCEPGWRWQPPPLSDYDLWYVAGGQGILQMGLTRWELVPGRCFVVPPGAQPRAVQLPDDRLIVFAVHFLPEESTSVPAEITPGGLLVNNRIEFELMARRAERTRARGDALGQLQSTLWVQQMLLQLVEEASLPPRTDFDSSVEEMVAAIRKEPGQWWSVDDMAAQVHLSRSQFTRRFRTATGTAPNEFIIRARLERARQLIEETDMPLAQISNVLGYSDVFFFSRQFKQHWGRPPGEWRRGEKP
jgi:AraC family transcriptional regulator of arabinose operon